MAVKVVKKDQNKGKPAIKPIHIPPRKPTSLKTPEVVKHGVRGEPDRPPPPPLLPDI